MAHRLFTTGSVITMNVEPKLCSRINTSATSKQIRSAIQLWQADYGKLNQIKIQELNLNDGTATLNRVNTLDISMREIGMKGYTSSFQK